MFREKGYEVEYVSCIPLEFNALRSLFSCKAVNKSEVGELEILIDTTDLNDQFDF